MIGKFFGFVFGLIGKAILLAMLLVLSGVLYVGSYFYQKSGEPMTVAEAQRRAPGITFRDFWASRQAQWRVHDEKFAEAKGRPGGCEALGTAFTAYRVLFAGPFVARHRQEGQKSVQYYNRLNVAENNTLPEMEFFYNGPFLDVVWAAIESSTWWQFANQKTRGCETSYPTPADVSAIRDATGALP